MNRNRAGGGDDDFAGVGEEPTFLARYRGTCGTCGQRFGVGDPIASVVVDTRSTYHHAACRYPATAYLEQADPGAAGVAGAGASAPVRCQATTKRGTPCGNAPQRGERYCGPHLTRARASGERDTG